MKSLAVTICVLITGFCAFIMIVNVERGVGRMKALIALALWILLTIAVAII